MNDRYFFDTNIFIYSFDSTQLQKQNTAKKLISDGLENGNGMISYQVIQEFLNVASGKFQNPLSVADCQKYLTVVLEPLCEIFASFELYHQCLDIMDRYHYSLYDSLIIAAALKGNCTLIYSEDLQHNQKIQDLRIVNPFVSTI